MTKTRLIYGEDDLDFKFPILLPSQHELDEFLINT